MKWVIGVLGACLILISIGMIIVTKRGVSVRTAPLIKPTLIDQKQNQIAEHLFLRLFPEWQQTELWIIGSDNSQEQTAIISELKAVIERQLKKTITISNTASFTTQDLQNCPAPCWVVTETTKANTLNSKQLTDLALLKRMQTLTFLNFNRNVEPSPTCLDEKIVSFDCMTPIGVNEVRKKLKDTHGRYFFARKYLDHDFFIFIEASK
ncbi:MAG: hypothetical protein ACLGGX_11265 [Bdellovibrionia bacterium]